MNAGEPCQVTLEGLDRAAWLTAADELNSALRMERLSSTCTRLVLRAADGGARLTFLASDGRSAERRIDEPIELIPTVQALSALLPAPDANSVASAEPKLQSAESARPTKPEPRVSAPAKPKTRPKRPKLGRDEGARTNDAPPENPYALSPIIGAQAGLRGGANRLITPMLTASIGLALDRWELGLVARYEAHYVVSTGENEDSPDTSGLVLGPTFGVRKAIGPCSLRAGGMLLLAALHEDGGAKSGRAEGRVGVYVGGAFPRASSTRFRIDWGAEVVPYNIGRSERNADGQWSLPWWAMTLALGLEFG